MYSSLVESRDKLDDEVSVIAVITQDDPKGFNSNDKRRRTEERGEVILLKQEPIKQSRRRDEYLDGRRLIELDDEKSKMALRKQLDAEVTAVEKKQQNRGGKEYKNIEILQKLPPGTIVIKQEAGQYKEDSDYVRDSTETNSSGGSSSTSGYAPGKVRRVHRVVRSKNRGPAEIRRNPMRVTKKEVDKDFPRPRQRLLSTKRRENLADLEPSKRAKSTMPYMNTRSVTRKMYNVGATYQAPTIRDETEWKEWPVHGMHERPVFHPQVGLAVEYLGRYFTSLDGLSYREIIDPEIEVVSVDPHCEFLPSSAEKKIADTKTGTSKNSKTPEETRSFETCMHESLHCVLGYCSQVMTTSYKNFNKSRSRSIQIENRGPNSSTMRQNDTEAKTETKQSTIVTLDSSASTQKNLEKFSRINCQKTVEPSSLEGCGISIPQSLQKSFQGTKAPRLFQMHTMYVASPQKSIALANLKALQSGRMKIQEIVKSTKNPLILINADSKIRGRQTKPSDAGISRLDDSVSDETLMEMSSIYKNLLPNEDSEGSGQRSVKHSKIMEFTVNKQTLRQDKLQNLKESKENDLESNMEFQSRETIGKSIVGSNMEFQSRETIGKSIVGSNVEFQGRETIGKSIVGSNVEFQSRETIGKSIVGSNVEFQGRETIGKSIVGSSVEFQGRETFGKSIVGSSVEFQGRETFGKSIVSSNVEFQGRETFGKSIVGSSVEFQGRETIGKSMVGSNETWCANETSEIAKILSEYNKSTSKKSAIENQVSSTSTSLKNVCPVTSARKTACNTETTRQNPQEGCLERNVNISFPQGKWRRFHFTVEKLKDLKSKSNKENEPSKNVEVLQRSQNVKTICLEEKKTSTGFEACNAKSLEELLENTALLYCSAAGVHQDDLANYIDSLDAKQSVQWLETWKNSRS